MSRNGNAPEQITPAAEWRRPRQEGVIFHFPSGMKAKVRPVNTDTFIRVGNVPDLLTALVGSITDSGTGENLTRMAAQEADKQMQIFNAFCVTCFVEPRCVYGDPNEDEISVDDISDEDKQQLFTYLGKPASALASFRPEQEKPVVSVVGQPSDTAST